MFLCPFEVPNAAQDHFKRPPGGPTWPQDRIEMPSKMAQEAPKGPRPPKTTSRGPLAQVAQAERFKLKVQAEAEKLQQQIQ